MRRVYPSAPILSFICLALAAPVSQAAVIIEESFDLVPGWNVIHVSVEPTEKNPLTALAAIDWESLWTWLPSETEPRGGRWLSTYRDAPAFLGSLFSVTGPNSYVIQARTAGTLRVKGAVRSNRQSARGKAYQLFGPSFDRASPPTFAAYFSRVGVKEHIGAAFELSGQTYRQVASSTPLRPGAAYWLFPTENIPEPEPLRLNVGLNGLRFDSQTTLEEIVVDIGVSAGGGAGGGVAPRQFELRVVPAVGDTGSTDWLEIQKPDGTFLAVGAGVTLETSAEQSQLRVTFRAQRDGLAGAGAGDQAAVVEIFSPQGLIALGAELEVPGLKGIWLGEATITEVERPTFHGGGFAPAPAVAVSLIFEVPNAGPPRLLPCIQINSARDGRNVSYRLEAALFHDIAPLSGTVASDGKSGNLVGTIAMAANHPLNPYRHRYHPEFGSGYEVTRSPKLRFGATLGGSPGDVEESPIASVGLLRGVYEEEIIGLSQEPLRVRGEFRLRRIAGGTVTQCAVGQ